MIRSTFTNKYGEDWEFEYNSELEKAIVKGSDVSWEEYPVIEGIACGLYMSKEEHEWLLSAWKAATQDKPNTGLYLGRDTEFQAGQDSCWLTNDYCPICLCKRREFEVHHCIWSCDGGTYDASNLLHICNSCHAVITRGSIEDRFPKNKAALNHQLMYFGLEFFPRNNPTKGRHTHLSFLEKNPFFKEELLGCDRLAETEKEHIDREIKRMARIEYQYFRDMSLGKWSWEQYEIRELKPSLEFYRSLKEDNPT